MEVLLGEKSRFILCTKPTSLTDEICKQDNFHQVSILIVSCLSGIISSLFSHMDAKRNIEKGMTMLGGTVADLVAMNPGLRVYIAQPTPRLGEDYSNAKKYAMVIRLESE